MKNFPNSSLTIILFFFLVSCGGDSSDKAGDTDSKILGSGNKFYAQVVNNNNIKECFSDLNLKGINGDVSKNNEKEFPLKRIMIALDASGSMAAKFGGKVKIDAAKKSTISYLNDIPEDVQVGFLAFGHKGTNEPSGKDESCAGVELLSSMSSGNRSSLKSTIDNLKPTGYTPLASAIEKAASQMKNSDIDGEQVLWVVSDGKESCGGDPVAVARKVHSGPLKLSVNIIGFDLKNEDVQQLKAIAEAGGGEFVQVDANNLDKFDESMRNLSARVDATLDAVKARGGNVTSMLKKINKAQNCMNKIIVEENNKMNKLLGGMVTMDDEKDKEKIKEANKMLEERHKKLKNLTQAYTESLRNKNAKKSAEIGAELDRVFNETSN